jgi:hypothetical protein
MKNQAANVVLTRHFLTPTGGTFTSRAKTCWDHRLLPKLRGRWNCEKREATTARQMTKWGMLTMQTSFPRVQDRFVYKEHGERRIVLKMFVLLYNMRARMVGINQIRNTYMRHLLRDANEDVFF